MVVEEDRLNDENPYAFFPESEKGTTWEHLGGNDEEPSTIEPRTPFSLKLLRTSCLRLDDRPCTMNVYSQLLRIEGENFPEPIVISREDAKRNGFFSSREFAIHFPGEKRLSFRISKSKNDELVLARLQYWAENESPAEPLKAVQKLETIICRNCSKITQPLTVGCGGFAMLVFVIGLAMSIHDIVINQTSVPFPALLRVSALLLGSLLFAVANFVAMYYIYTGRMRGFLWALSAFSLALCPWIIAGIFDNILFIGVGSLSIIMAVVFKEYISTFISITLLRNENLELFPS